MSTNPKEKGKSYEILTKNSQQGYRCDNRIISSREDDILNSCFFASSNVEGNFCNTQSNYIVSATANFGDNRSKAVDVLSVSADGTVIVKRLLVEDPTYSDYKALVYKENKRYDFPDIVSVEIKNNGGNLTFILAQSNGTTYEYNPLDFGKGIYPINGTFSTVTAAPTTQVTKPLTDSTTSKTISTSPITTPLPTTLTNSPFSSSTTPQPTTKVVSTTDASSSTASLSTPKISSTDTTPKITTPKITTPRVTTPRVTNSTATSASSSPSITPTITPTNTPPTTPLTVSTPVITNQPNANSTRNNEDNRSGISAGGVTGIVIAVVIVFGIVIYVIYRKCRAHLSYQNANENRNDLMPMEPLATFGGSQLTIIYENGRTSNPSTSTHQNSAFDEDVITEMEDSEAEAKGKRKTVELQLKLSEIGGKLNHSLQNIEKELGKNVFSKKTILWLVIALNTEEVGAKVLFDKYCKTFGVLYSEVMSKRFERENEYSPHRPEMKVILEVAHKDYTKFLSLVNRSLMTIGVISTALKDFKVPKNDKTSIKNLGLLKESILYFEEKMCNKMKTMLEEAIKGVEEKLFPKRSLSNISLHTTSGKNVTDETDNLDKNEYSEYSY